jgi:hypothetical protein
MPRAPWIRRLALAGLLVAGIALADGEPGEPPRRGDGPPPAARPMERGDFIAWLKENHPEEAKRLADLRETDPEAFRRAVGDLARKYRQHLAPPPPDDAPPPRAGEHDFGRILEHLRQSDPARYEELNRLRVEDPQAFRQTMQEWFRENYDDYVDLVFGAEKRCQELARRYHAAKTDEERAAIEPQLRAAVDAAFQERLAIQKQRVEQMEQQLAKYREQLQEREKNRDKIVTARLAELQADPLPAPRSKDGEPPRRPPQP